VEVLTIMLQRPSINCQERTRGEEDGLDSCCLPDWNSGGHAVWCYPRDEMNVGNMKFILQLSDAG
jgi:hypothetical protein